MLTKYEWAILIITAVSAIGALIAALIARAESRRNNSVVLGIEACSFSMSTRKDENAGLPFTEFRVLLRNKGLPLYSMIVEMTFLDKQGYGMLSIKLRSRSLADESDVFGKGMIADVGLKSYELNDLGRTFISRIEDPKKQRACLCVYSQGYLARTFRMASLIDTVKQKWNERAYWFNGLLERQKGHNEKGNPVVKPFRIMPVFVIMEQPLRLFADYIRTNTGAAQPSNSPEKPTA